MYDMPLKSIDLCIPRIPSTTTKEVIALTNDGLKGENEKVKNSQNLYKY